jgi:hypothetical protein
MRDSCYLKYLKGTDHVEELGADKKIILTWILKE